MVHNCDGEQECVLEATGGQFGDPCVGTRKYLGVRIIQWNNRDSLALIFPRFASTTRNYFEF